MTPEERIAQLEAENRELRAVVATQASALADAMAERRKAADAKDVLEARRLADRERQRQSRLLRKVAREQAMSRDSVHASSRDSHVTPPSPLLDGSPLSSKPSLPSPLSSPQPLFASVAPAPSQGELVKSPKRSTAAEEFRDWARAESRKLLPPDAPDNCTVGGGMWPRLGKAMKEQGMAKMQAAYRLFLTDTYWKGQGLPLSGFVAKWEQFAGRVTATSQQAPSDLLPKADDPDWVTV